MLNLSPKEVKAIANIIKGINGYKSMCEDRLLTALKASELLKEIQKNFDDTKPKLNFYKARIAKIREEFSELGHKFSKSKINEIRRNLYEIENEKNLFSPRIKEIERNLLELEENLFKPKKYCDYDDTEYKGIRDVKDLFDFSIDEDYYKPIIAKGCFNNSYTLYESIGDKGKKLSMKKYLDMIRPYLSDMINNHQTQGKLIIHSDNKIIERKTQSKWKIQLTMETNFISCKDSDETHTMHAKGDNVKNK